MSFKSIRMGMMAFSLVILLCGCNKNEDTGSPEPSTAVPPTSTLSEVSAGKATVAESTQTSAQSSQSETAAAPRETNVATERSTEGSIRIIVSDDGENESRSGDVSTIDLNRPAFMKGMEVFDGWEQEAQLPQLLDGAAPEDDVPALTPESIDISNSENVLYNDVTYVNPGMEHVSIPVTVGGNPNFSIMELEISYDPSLLEYESFLRKDADAECNCPEPGLICLSFVSTDNVKADIELCDIQFKALSPRGTQTALKYTIKDIAAWNENKTGYIDVPHEVINSRIVML